jgi:hypothetical protein
MKRYFLLFGLALAYCAGGQSEEIAESKIEKAQWGAGVAFYNNVGTGTLAPAHRRKSDFSSNLTLKPQFLTAPVYKDRRIKLWIDQDIGFQWIDPKSKTAKVVSLADLKFKGNLKNALLFPDAGFSFSPEVRIEAPVSNSSSMANRIVGFGGVLTTKWSKGPFVLTYKPGMAGYIYSGPYKSTKCAGAENSGIADDTPLAFNPRKPGFTVGEYLGWMRPSISKSKLADGKCIVNSRQALASFENGLYAEYAPTAAHTFMVGAKLSHSLLRPMSQTPKLVGQGVPLGHFSTSTSGVVEYTYTLPTKISSSISLGVASSQPAFDEKGSFNLPFFDYKTPANNFTQLYLGLDLSV